MNAGLFIMGVIAACSVAFYLIARTDKGRKWLIGDH